MFFSLDSARFKQHLIKYVIRSFFVPRKCTLFSSKIVNWPSWISKLRAPQLNEEFNDLFMTFFWGNPQGPRLFVNFQFTPSLYSYVTVRVNLVVSACSEKGCFAPVILLVLDWLDKQLFFLVFFVAVPTARDRPQMQGISDPYSLFMLLRVWSDPENVRDAVLPLLMSREEEIRLALCLF